MKCALLIADYVNENLLPLNGDLEKIFRDFLPFNFDAFAVTQGNFPGLNDYDCFIITGSRHAPHDDLPWLHKLKQLIKDALQQQRKLVGFCFGHQLLAQVLGGEVMRFTSGGNYGLQRVAIQQYLPWMQPALNFKKLLFNHQYYVKTMPVNTQIIAATKHFIQMFSYEDLVLGIQFHPEYSIEYQKNIMPGYAVYQPPSPIEIRMLGEAVLSVKSWVVKFLDLASFI